MGHKKCLIERGKHYCNKWWIPHFYFKRTLNFTIKIESTVDYKLPTKYRKDTQKIFGISDGFGHHKNSIRLGCRVLDGRLEFRVYYYIDGIHYSDLCYWVDISNNLSLMRKSYNGSIEIKRDKYIFKFANTTTLINRKSRWFGPRYLLFPFFGNKTKPNTAPPFNIRINIKWGFDNMYMI